MKRVFNLIFSANDGISHKRILGAIGFLSLVIFMFTSNDNENTKTLIEAVEYVTIAYGLGTVVEKFTKSENKTEEEING